MTLDDMREKLLKLEIGSRLLLAGKQYEVTGLFQFDNKRLCDTKVWLVENDAPESVAHAAYRVTKDHPRATANEMRIVPQYDILTLDWKARASDMNWEFV